MATLCQGLTGSKMEGWMEAEGAHLQPAFLYTTNAHIRTNTNAHKHTHKYARTQAGTHTHTNTRASHPATSYQCAVHPGSSNLRGERGAG